VQLGGGLNVFLGGELEGDALGLLGLKREGSGIAACRRRSSSGKRRQAWGFGVLKNYWHLLKPERCRVVLVSNTFLVGLRCLPPLTYYIIYIAYDDDDDDAILTSIDQDDM